MSAADQLACALAATLSNNAHQRKAAEALLSQLAGQEHHAAHLLRLSAGGDAVVAPAASLRLKNLIRTQNHQSIVPEAARERVRDDLLIALAAVRGTNVEGVLAETTRWLVLVDFPAKWPKLIPDIQDSLASGDSARVHAALVALRQLVKCYEFKSRDPNNLAESDPNDAGLAHPRQPLDAIAASFFPTLNALYLHLDDIVAKQPYENPERRNACLAQRLIVKVFWSCTQFILPPVLAEPNVLDQWLNPFFETMRRPCRHPYIDDADDIAMEPEWKTKKWLGQVMTRFLKRYGTPNRVPVDEPWAKRVAEMFRDRHSEKATTVMLEVLSTGTKGHQISYRVAHLALDFIEEAIETASLWAVIHPHVDSLLAHVVFPYLSFSEADEDVWISDPSEYVRKQYDFTDDLTSPRTAASNLLAKMADLRSKSTVLPFLQYLLQSVLDPYQRAPVGSPQRAQLARQKVGAFSALAAVKGKLMSKNDLADSFLQVLKTHVEPDIQSEYGFLRSESAWLLGQVASCGWERFTNELGQSCLSGCVSLLQDREMPVQAAAAGSLQFLMDQEGGTEIIRAVSPQLLERLLGLMDSMSDVYLTLTPALDKLVAQYPDEILPLALPLVQRLIAAFKQSADTLLVDGDDDDDEMAFTAAQILLLISSVVSSLGEWDRINVEEKKRIFASLEKELEPFLSSMFDESHQVFIEELLDILGILVMQVGSLKGGFSPFLMGMIPKMVHGFEIWAADYVEHMLETIEGYLLFGLEQMVKVDGAVGAFVRMVQQLWSAKYDDSDAIYGTRIAGTLLLNLSQIKPGSEQLAAQVAIEVGRKAGERCIITPEDQTGLRQRLFAVVMLCVYIDGNAVLKGLGAQSVMQLIGSQTGNLLVFDRLYAKKAIVLGLSGILRTRGLVLEESKPHVLGVALRLEQMIAEQRRSTAESAENSVRKLENMVKEENGTTRYGLDGYGSDLDDNEDASNFADELNEHRAEELKKLAEGTGLGLGTLEELHVTNGLSNGLFDLEIDMGEDDEGGKGSVLDEIDECEYLVETVRECVGEAWWARVSDEERNALEAMAKQLGR